MDGRDILDDYRLTRAGIQYWHDLFPGSVTVIVNGDNIPMMVRNKREKLTFLESQNVSGGDINNPNGLGALSGDTSYFIRYFAGNSLVNFPSYSNTATLRLNMTKSMFTTIQR